MIEFEPRFHHARFYLGSCADGRVLARFEEHCAGRGAKIVAAAIAAGCVVSLALVAPGGFEDERRFKKWENNIRVYEVLKKRAVKQNETQ